MSTSRFARDARVWDGKRLDVGNVCHAVDAIAEATGEIAVLHVQRRDDFPKSVNGALAVLVAILGIPPPRNALGSKI